MANAIVAKATLVDVKLHMIECEVLIQTDKGSINVENEVSFRKDEADNKKFIMHIATTLQGVTKIKGEDEVAFNAKANWDAQFTHSQKVNLGELEKNSELYASKVYSYTRSFISDVLFKMGVNISTMPWEINPNN